MLPIRLELKNFLPYRSPDPLRFAGIHLACLTGPNGAGKSSLLDAITWVLWGKARARRDDELVHLGQADMSVQLDFEQEGIVYRVIRRRARGTRSAGTLDLFAHDGAGFNLISEPSMRDTQEKINRLLRLEYETFVNSAFLQQGKADAFTTKTPAQRKQILADILGLEQWERYEEAAKAILREIETQIEVFEMRLEEIAVELAREPALREQLEEAERVQAEAQRELEQAEAHLAEVAHAPTELKNAKERLATQQRRKREHESDLEAAAVDIAAQQKRIAGYEAVIAARGDIEKGYATLRSAREADHELGDKLLQLSDFEEQYRELERKLDAARTGLENEASGYEATIVELERALAGVASGEYETVRAEIEALEALQAKRDALQNQVNALNEQKAQIRGAQERHTADGRSFNDRMQELEQIEGAVCPLCGQPLDDAHRQQIIAQLIAERDQLRENYRINQEKTEAIDGQIRAERETVAGFDIELKRLQPLMKRAGELQSQIERAADAGVRLDETRAALAAVHELLESAGYARDLRGQLAALETRRSEIGYDRETHDAARKQLDDFREYDRRHQELEVALNSLPDAEKALEAARGRHARLEQAIAEDDRELEALAANIEQLNVLVAEQKLRQEEVNRLRTLERQTNERLVQARQQLATLDAQRARKAELEQRREQQRHQQALYDELRVAFGKKGVPAMIIEAAIPELEVSANHLLQRMTDGRMSLKLETLRERVTGGVAETLDIQISDELGTRNYELYSGGEAYRINFALRVALSQMLARRAGAHLRTLFIDEGFGTQDDDGRDKLVEAITAVQDHFDLILVITHIDELRDSFPVHVVVEKTAAGSRISVR